MKKTHYIVALILGAFLLLSCEEESPIVPVDPDIPAKELGELKASFKTLDVEGKESTTFDIGDQIFFVDLSEGRPDSRDWAITGATPETSDKRNFVAAYPREGSYNVGLTVNRSQDNTSHYTEKADFITINWIPVEAAFSQNVVKSRGKCYIKVGDYINFMDASSGMPGIWNWQFEGGSPELSNASSPRVQYRTVGQFDVSLEASRDDGDGKLSSDSKSRSNFIVVEERSVEVKVATFSKGQAMLKFSDPMAIVDADALKDEIIAVATNNGKSFPLAIGSVKVSEDDPYSLVLTLDGDLYEDDELSLSMGISTNLYDSTMLTAALPFTTPCDVVGFEEGNILDAEYVGFENGNTAINKAYCDDYYIGQSDADASYIRTEDEAYVGDASMRFMKEVPTTGEGAQLYGMFFSDNTLAKNSCEYIPAGEYMLYQPIFIKKECNIKTFKFIISERADWSPYVEKDWRMDNLPRGRWVVMRTLINVEKDLGVQQGERSAGTRSTYRVDAAGNEEVSGVQTFYLDGMAMVPVTNKRPME